MGNEPKHGKATIQQGTMKHELHIKKIPIV